MKTSLKQYEARARTEQMGRTGRIYGALAGAAGVARRRWFLLLVRDGLLFLAVALAALAVGNTQVNWRLWWPLPLALAAVLMTLALHEAAPMRWRHFIPLLIFAAPVFARARLGLATALPAAGLRECRELGLILALGTAIWLAASCHPARTLAAWVAGVAIGGLASWSIAGRLNGADRLLINNNFRVFMLITLAAGALAGACLALAAPLKQGRVLGTVPELEPLLRERFTAKHVLIDLLCLVFLALGLSGGAMLAERQLDAPLRAALAIHEGLAAQRALWLQSILFGWGDVVLDRLIHVTAEPAMAIAPPWGGLTGGLARGGIAGLAVLAGWSLVLNRRVRRSAGSGQGRALVLPAGLAAFFLIGLLATGAPQTRLGALVLAGWLGLALARPVAGRGHAAQARRPGFGPTVLTLLLLALLAGLLALPACAGSLLASVQRYGAKKTGDWARQRLYTARDLNPFDPAIPLALARTWPRPGEGTETDTIAVLRFYQDAQRLDPYDTIVPLRLANLQLAMDRQEDAVKTVQDALKRRGNAQDLLGWMFWVALRLNQNALADQVLQQALGLDPMNTGWWQHQFALARRLGQGPLAAQALATALTGAPDNPMLVSATWAAANTPTGVPAADAGVPAAGVPPS